MISIKTLIKGTTELIKKDTIILAPCLIGSAISYLLIKTQKATMLTPKEVPFSIWMIMGIIIGIQCLAYTLTLISSQQLLQKKEIQLWDTVKKSIQIFPKLIAMLILLAIFMTGVGFSLNILQSISLPLITPVFKIISSIAFIAAIIGFLICLETFPLFLILKNQPITQSIKSACKLIYNEPKSILLLNALIINLKLLVGLLGSLANQIPILGEGALLILLDGVCNTYIYVMCLIFLEEVQKQDKSTVEILEKNHDLPD